jgi:type I restriction enzyme S subunit
LVTLGDVIDGFESGRNLKASGAPADADEFGVLKISAVTWGEFDPTENKALLSHDRPKPRELVRADDLLITRANTTELVGAVVLVGRDYPKLMLPDKILRLLVRDGLIDRRFLLQAMRTHHVRKFFESVASGTSDSMRNISQAKLVETPIPLPPLNEQRRIVAKIDALMARSRRAKESLDAIPPLLERLRQSILGAAFRGDLTADWRAQNPDVEPIEATVSRVDVKPPRSGRSETIAVRPGRSALSVGDPETPAPPGWRWYRLTEVARLESGHTPSRRHPEYWDGPIHWVGITDARDSHGGVLRETYQRITQAGLDNSAARLLPAGTVCLVRTAASIGYVTILGREMATSQDLVNWVCSDAIVPEFLMHLLIAEKQSILSFGKGSAHRTVYYPEVKAFHVCLPPVAEQREIVRLVELQLANMERLRDAFESALAAGQTLDRAILAKAFRGELVPQDPNDEPAEQMLARLASTEAPTKTKRGRRKKDA